MGLDKLNWRFLKLWIKTYIATAITLAVATGIILLVIKYPLVGLFLAALPISFLVALSYS